MTRNTVFTNDLKKLKPTGKFKKIKVNIGFSNSLYAYIDSLLYWIRLLLGMVFSHYALRRPLFGFIVTAFSAKLILRGTPFIGKVRLG